MWWITHNASEYGKSTQSYRRKQCILPYRTKVWKPYFRPLQAAWDFRWGLSWIWKIRAWKRSVLRRRQSVLGTQKRTNTTQGYASPRCWWSLSLYDQAIWFWIISAVARLSVCADFQISASVRDRSRLAETCQVKQSRQGLLQRSDSQTAAISAWR